LWIANFLLAHCLHAVITNLFCQSVVLGGFFDKIFSLGIVTLVFKD
jgi:hypothetical protein